MLNGETLRQMRHRRGRTQADVAAQVGIPSSVLSAYERGRREPGLRMALRIVDALGYRIEVVPALDPSVQARKLEDVLGLAEHLPYRPRPMERARR